jgi:hypothetical protein
MVEFETVKAKDIKFGRNNFIEISRKKAITDNGENEFISIGRGFYLDDGEKRWKSSITLPSERDKLEKIADLIKSI